MSVVTNDGLQSTIALAALEQVVDPELGLNVVDLGLIYQVDFDDAAMALTCTMTLTTSFCPMGAALTDAVKHKLKGYFPAYAVKINLTFDPPWKPDRISEGGRLFLNER